MPCITVCFSTEIFYVLSLQVCNIYWLFEYLCLKREKADLVHSSTKINRFGVPRLNLGLARGGVQKQLEAASGRETGVSCPHRTWYMCMYMCMYQRCTNRRCSQGHAGCFTSVELVLLDILSRSLLQTTYPLQIVGRFQVILRDIPGVHVYYFTAHASDGSR